MLNKSLKCEEKKQSFTFFKIKSVSYRTNYTLVVKDDFWPSGLSSVLVATKVEYSMGRTFAGKDSLFSFELTHFEIPECTQNGSLIYAS